MEGDSPFYWTHVQHFKTGATDSSGNNRMCTRCSREARHSDTRRRRRQATVTAHLRYGDRNSYKVPVAYCDEHIPEELEEAI